MGWKEMVDEATTRDQEANNNDSYPEDRKMTNTSNVSNVTNDKNIDRSNKNGQGISNDTFTRLVNRDEQSRNDIRNMVNSQTSVPGVAGFRRTRKCEDDEEGGESTVLDGEVFLLDMWMISPDLFP